MKKKKATGLAVFLYVMGVVMLIVFAYMLVSGIMYIRTYMEAYTMTISDAWQYMLQYMVSGTLEYLVYGILFFAAGKIIKLIGNCYDICYGTAEADCCSGGWAEKSENTECEAYESVTDKGSEVESDIENTEIVDITVSEDAIEETRTVGATRSRRSRRRKH